MNNSTSPSGTGTSGGGRKQMAGPCYLKLIVNNMVAGSIIGKNGSVISSIENNTGCELKLSGNSVCFPGTNDRIVILSGNQDQLTTAMLVVLDKIKDYHKSGSGHEDAPTGSGPALKMVLPNSSISSIIGKGGQQIKSLQENTGARVQVSNREEGISERIVTISGPVDNLEKAAISIATNIQSDPNLKDYLNLNYHNMHIGGGYMMGGGGGGYNNGYVNSVGGGGMGYGMGGGGGFGGGSGGGFGNGYGNSDFGGRSCEIEVHIPDQLVGAIIGKNGSSLTEITNASNAKIRISQKGELIEGTEDRKCVISGTVEAVHTAHVIILQKLEAAQQLPKSGHSGAGDGIADRQIGGRMIVGGGGGGGPGNSGGSGYGRQMYPY